MTLRKEVIVIAAGGTGGHIFPALSIAKELKKRKEERGIVFIGSKRGLERKIIPREGFEFIEMDMAGMKGKRLLAKSQALMKAISSFFRCLVHFRKLKPSIVIGTGGYVSGPAVFAGWVLGIPTLIQEQNLTPGITNRFLSRLVTETAISFDESRRYLHGRVTLTGNPVREEFLKIKKKKREEPLSILIFGGSQGARTINRAMMESLPLLKDVKEQLKIVHQTGPADKEIARKAYHKGGFSAEVHEFIMDMPQRFEEADLIICRSGASTIAEIIAAGKASILVPFPKATDDHQRQNAHALEKRGAAKMCEDSNFSGAYIASQILTFLKHPALIDEMEKNASSLYEGWATGKIVDMTERIMMKG